VRRPWTIIVAALGIVMTAWLSRPADPALLRRVARLLDQAGLTLPDFTLLGELSTE